jgi:hypothetical protein
MRVSRESNTTNPVGSVRIIRDTSQKDHDKTPFENFEGLEAKLLKVPKEELDEKRVEQEKARKQKQD